MSYKLTTKLPGLRFLGNSSPSKMEVHDLQRMTGDCQIDEILRAGHAVDFVPDSLTQAKSEGYDNCYWCIGGSKR